MKESMNEIKNETKGQLNANLKNIEELRGLVSNRLLSKVAGEVVVDYYQRMLRDRDYEVTRQFIVEQTNLMLKKHNFNTLSYAFFRKYKF